MNYVTPFEAVRSLVPISQSSHGTTSTVPHEIFLDALRLLLAGINMDEGWYLAQNPDVAEAIREGTTGSAKQHFVEHGWFEGRLPFRIAVDERWYLLQNPDVAENVRKGVVESAQRHFESDGYKEGRLPFPLDGSRSRRTTGHPVRLVASA